MQCKRQSVGIYAIAISLTLSCFFGLPKLNARDINFVPAALAKTGKPSSVTPASQTKNARREENVKPEKESPTKIKVENQDELSQWTSPKSKDLEKGSSILPKKPGTAANTTKEEEYVKLLSMDHIPTDLKALGESIVKIRKQVTDHPQDPFLRFKLGTHLYLVGDLEGAAAELSNSININPSSASARAQLGKVLELGGKHMDALQQFRRAVEISPNSPEVHFLFGESLMHGGNVQEAVNEYRRSIALQPSADALAGLSEGLFASGDIHGALEASRHAVSLDSTLARAQVALTNALLKSGDKISALRTARQSMLLSPNSPDSHLALGRCLFATGDQSTAVEEFKQAVALDPLNPSARNDLGYALYGRGEIVPAVTEFRLALRLNPRFVEARNNLEVAIHRLYSGK